MADPQIYVIPGATRTEYVTRTVNHHEHRAPTDQSVALLKEMELAARAKIEQSIHVGNTTFECVVHVMQDMAEACMRMKAVFKLNGVTANAEHSYRPRDQGDHIKAANALRDEVAKVIAAKMLESAFAAINFGR